MAEILENFVWWADHSPRSMAISDGKVLIAPTMEKIEITGAKVTDCNGHILLPKFVDAHCHILPTGIDLLHLDLSACTSKREVLEAVRQRASTTQGWIMGVQYDHTKFADASNVTRNELDEISSTRPIFLEQYNGHASIANSAALLAANVTEETTNPEGGEFGRDENGRMNGLLLELAHERVLKASPKPSKEEIVVAILAAGEKMADLGIGMAADMMTGCIDLEDEIWAYSEAARRGCRIRTRLYIQWKEVFGPRGIGIERLRELEESLQDPDRCRIAGIKLFADGAIGSATAAIYGSYTGREANGPKISSHGRKTEQTGTSGQLIYSSEKLIEMTKLASEAGYQVAIHAIGDYATDLVLDAFEATGVPERHRLEHAMMLSDSQIERIAALNPFVTFQPEFLLRFGHAYRLQLGEERASKLKRARSVLDRGVRLSFNSDRPIVAGDPMDGIRTAINRPVGYDASENISLIEAVQAYTRSGALACSDNLLGSLEVGEFVDYQLMTASQWSQALEAF